MKILLVNPCCFNDTGRDLHSAHVTGPLFTLPSHKKPTFAIPLALSTPAAYTPVEYDVKIVDEEIEDIDFISIK
jgi:hypothetical protein